MANLWSKEEKDALQEAMEENKKETCRYAVDGKDVSGNYDWPKVFEAFKIKICVKKGNGIYDGKRTQDGCSRKASRDGWIASEGS